MKKGLLFFVLTLSTISCKEDAQVCIDKSKIEADVVCDYLYRPVCGCDNITYYNACEAENKSGINLYTEGTCPHICSYNDTLMVLATNDNCTLLTDYTNTFYEVDYAPENSLWVKDKYYLLHTIQSYSTPSCGGEKSINILCVLPYDKSCSALINTTGTDDQLSNDSLVIEAVNITDNCLNIEYNYLGGCDDTRLNAHHLVDSSSSELIRLQLRYDNGGGPCTDTITEYTSFNLGDLQVDNQNSVTISIDCNGDDSFNEMLTYEY